MKENIAFGTVINGVVMVAIAASILHPFMWLFFSSFKLDSDIVSYPPTFLPSTYTLKQYIEVWKRIPLLRLFVNTIIFAGTVTLVSLILDSMAGYAFARIRFKWRRELFAFTLVTMMVPFQVLMIPLFVEIYRFGLLNTYWGLILPRATSAFGIYMMRSFFVSLPKDLEEAARIDGLNEFGIFLRIMLPLCKPALVTLGIFHFMSNWNDLIYPLVLTSSSEMRTLPAGLAMFIGERVIEYGPTLAATVLSILPLLVSYVFAQKYFVQSVVMTGLKE